MQKPFTRFFDKRMIGSLPAIRRHYSKLLGENTLVFARGRKWRENRTIMHMAFVDEALQHAQKTILQTSLRIEHAMINTCAIQSNQYGGWRVEAYALCKMATLDVFGMAALGYDFGCSSTGIMTSEHSSIFRRTEFFQREVTSRCFEERWNILAQFYWIPTFRNIRHFWELRSYRNVILAIVQAKRAALKHPDHQEAKETKPNGILSSSKQDDTEDEHQERIRSAPLPDSIANSKCSDNLTLLDFMLRGRTNKSSPNGPEPLSDLFVSEFLMSIVFGGYDSTALNLSYTLYLLATHPEHQDRCAKESSKVLGESGCNNAPIDSFLSVADLPYCYAALLESLRYYPPVAMSSRDLVKPISLDIDVDPVTGECTKVEIPAGVRFIASFYCVNHAECNFPSPDEYLPERWVQQDEQGRWQPRTAENDCGGSVPRGLEQKFLTFSAGARSCVGRPLSIRLVTTLLAAIVRTFHVEIADPNYKIELKRFGLNQIPKGGIPLRLRRRETPVS